MANIAEKFRFETIRGGGDIFPYHAYGANCWAPGHRDRGDHKLGLTCYVVSADFTGKRDSHTSLGSCLLIRLQVVTSVSRRWAANSILALAQSASVEVPIYGTIPCHGKAKTGTSMWQRPIRPFERYFSRLVPVARSQGDRELDWRLFKHLADWRSDSKNEKSLSTA